MTPKKKSQIRAAMRKAGIEPVSVLDMHAFFPDTFSGGKKNKAADAEYFASRFGVDVVIGRKRPRNDKD